MPGPKLTPVARAIRDSARIALWGALALSFVAGGLLYRHAQPIAPPEYFAAMADQAKFDGVDFLSYREVRLLRDYVRINTSYPDPNEIAGAEFLAAQLAAAGVKSTIERFRDGRANLWAFVEGEDPEALVLLGHIDVEPAQDQKGWDHPPYGGVIQGPWIYGRGMYDMKSLAIAQLLATIDVAQAAAAGKKPKRSILFLQTSSEETGGDTGTQWLLAEHPELVRRMGVVLTEGGVVEATGPSEIKYWGIEFAQKQFARTTVCSARRGDLVALSRLLERTGKGDPIGEVHPAVVDFLASYDRSRGLGSFHDLLGDPDALPRFPGRFERLTPFMKSLFRNEAVGLAPRRAEGGGWEMDVWLHLMPGADFEQATRALLPESIYAGLAHTPLTLASPPGVSPLDHPVYTTVAAVVAERFPDVAVGPYFLPWAMTDSRRFRALGIPAYGHNPFPVIVFDTVQIGKPNERMQLPAYLEGIELFRETIRRIVM